jgi:hypothetical protein
MMIANGEFEDRPWGMSYGEVMRPPAVSPPPPPEPFHIEPWSEQERREAAASVPSTDEIPESAVEAMMREARERGEVDFPEARFGGPAHIEPLTRPVFPEPDWNAEEYEAILRNRRERLAQARQTVAEAAAEEESSSYPPARRGAA